MGSTQKPAKPPKRKDLRIGRPHRALGPAPSRSHKYSTVDIAGLLAAVARGIPIGVACRARNINRDTFQEWLNTREDFALAHAKAIEAEIDRALTAIKAGSKMDEIKGWMFWLERVARDHFSPPQQGLSLGVQNNTFVISYEKARQIEAMRTELLPKVDDRLGLSNGSTDGRE